MSELLATAPAGFDARGDAAGLSLVVRGGSEDHAWIGAAILALFVILTSADWVFGLQLEGWALLPGAGGLVALLRGFVSHDVHLASDGIAYERRVAGWVWRRERVAWSDLASVQLRTAGEASHRIALETRDGQTRTMPCDQRPADAAWLVELLRAGIARPAAPAIEEAPEAARRREALAQLASRSRTSA